MHPTRPDNLSGAFSVTTEHVRLAAFLYAGGHEILSASLVPNTQNLKRFEFAAAAAEGVGRYYTRGAIAAKTCFAALRDCKALANRSVPSNQISHSEAVSNVSRNRR